MNLDQTAHPLNSSSDGQEGAIFNESTPTNNDRVALLPQDQVTNLSTSSDFSRRRSKNDIDIVVDDQQPDPPVGANQQHIRITGDDQHPSETVETVHQPDNTADYTVHADQQAKPSFSDPDCHKNLKIKVMDATNTIPDKIMEVDYHGTVTGLKNLIILEFLKEEELDPCRIRLTFKWDSFLASTSPQGRKSRRHFRIPEETKLGDIFGGERAYKDDLKVKVEVQILPYLE